MSESGSAANAAREAGSGWGYVLACGCVDAFRPHGDMYVWVTVQPCENHRASHPEGERATNSSGGGSER